MKRTLMAAALLTALGTAVLTTPATAEPAAEPVITADSLSPGLLDAMSRDLGLSPEAALHQLAEEDKASRVDQALRGSLADGYAGAYIDPADGDLVVGVTDAGKTDEVRAAGAEAAVVRHSSRHLESTVGALDTATAPAGVTGWYVDVQRNTVVLTAAAGGAGAATDFVSAAGADKAAVSVTETSEAPRPLYDVVGGDAYYMGGRCSVGFSVQGGFVTAGHCGTPGTATQGYNRVSQGTFRGSSFPTNDYAWVATNSSWTPRGVVNRYNGGTVAVRGSQEAPVGASVCRSGSTTGWRCGTIQSKNQTVRYPEGTIYGMTRTNACAEPGDSGGSWLSGNQAQGVTSGGSGNCTSGGTTYFQPVNEILSAYGLRLVTS